MTITPVPPEIRALHQAIDEALLSLSSRLCVLRLDEEALDEAILPPEFAAARQEADALRQAWKEQWRTVIAPALMAAGTEPTRIDALRRDLLRAIDGVSEDRTWAVATRERNHG